MVIPAPSGKNVIVQLESASNTAAMSVRVLASDATEAVCIDIKTTGTPITRNQCNRILIGIKQSTNNRKILVNGTDQSLTVTTFSTTNIASMAAGDLNDSGLGTYVTGDGNPGGNPYAGAWYRPWINFGSGVYFDPVTNEVKFWNASGSPANLGANGEIPTGSSPVLYFPNGPSNFGTNLGTGGNHTIFGSFTGIAPPT